MDPWYTLVFLQHRNLKVSQKDWFFFESIKEFPLAQNTCLVSFVYLPTWKDMFSNSQVLKNILKKKVSVSWRQNLVILSVLSFWACVNFKTLVLWNEAKWAKISEGQIPQKVVYLCVLNTYKACLTKMEAPEQIGKSAIWTHKMRPFSCSRFQKRLLSPAPQ